MKRIGGVNVIGNYQESFRFEGKCVICGHNKTLWESVKPKELSVSYCPYCRDKTMTVNIKQVSNYNN